MFIWIVSFHIITLLCWSGALIYFPILLLSTSEARASYKIPRTFFTAFLTPAAMLTILTGILLFVFLGTMPKWLMLKITLVLLLVIVHVLNGFLILWAEQNIAIKQYSFYLLSASAIIIIAIFTLVLAKPFLGT